MNLSICSLNTCSFEYSSCTIVELESKPTSNILVRIRLVFIENKQFITWCFVLHHNFSSVSCDLALFSCVIYNITLPFFLHIDSHYLVIPVEHIPTVKDLKRRPEDLSLGRIAFVTFEMSTTSVLDAHMLSLHCCTEFNHIFLIQWITCMMLDAIYCGEMHHSPHSIGMYLRVGLWYFNLARFKIHDWCFAKIMM